MGKRQWVVYLIRCADQSLYCGITNNLNNRLIAHNSGKGAKYTRFRRPVELVGTSAAMTKSDALKLEHRVKHVPAYRKYDELMKVGHRMVITFNEAVESINKEVKELTKIVGKITVAVGKLINL